MRDATKLFLISVAPPVICVLILGVCYLRGDVAARGLLKGLLLLASVWLVAGVWGYADWRFRRVRRRKG